MEQLVPTVQNQPDHERKSMHTAHALRLGRRRGSRRILEGAAAVEARFLCFCTHTHMTLVRLANQSSCVCSELSRTSRAPKSMDLNTHTRTKVGYTHTHKRRTGNVI